MKPAIIVPAISAFISEGRELVRAVQEGEAMVAAFDIKLAESRQEAEKRRMAAGQFLLKVRDRLPRRSATNEGWTAFLEAIELDDSTAHRWMDAANPSRLTTRSNEVQVREGAFDERPTPAPSDGDEPPNVACGEPEVVIDRDTWCTPAELAAALGDWDLDPCSNERSHIQAAREFRLEERGEDGLVLASSVDAGVRVFINPPYSDVMPWVKAYAHTRFCFLLKFDPSTKWFSELLEHASAVFLPRGTRIEFEPPPGVPPEKAYANQFPHALFYARAKDATKAIRDFCFPPWSIR